MFYKDIWMFKLKIFWKYLGECLENNCIMWCVLIFNFKRLEKKFIKKKVRKILKYFFNVFWEWIGNILYVI